MSKMVARYLDLFGRPRWVRIERPYWDAIKVIAKIDAIPIERVIMKAAQGRMIAAQIREYCMERILREVKQGDRPPSTMRAPWKPR